MNIKKIVKRNIKNICKGAFDLSLKIALTPFTSGFAHASYLYFYITNPNGSDDELDRFLTQQHDDFVAAENRILDKISRKIGFEHHETKVEGACAEYDKPSYEVLVEIFDHIASYPEKKEAYCDGYDRLPSTEYMRDCILSHIDTADENIKYLFNMIHGKDDKS
jgi:hypothetical protein